jgi:hypothetical protein
MKQLFENWNRYLNEADYGEYTRKPRGPEGAGHGHYGGGRYANDQLTKFEDRLAKLGIDAAQEVVRFLIGLASMGDDPAEWSEGEREQTIDDLTDILATQSDPNQEPVSDEELERMQLPPEFVLLRVDNKKAQSVMKSIRSLLQLPAEQQEWVIDELMMFTKLKERE